MGFNLWHSTKFLLNSCRWPGHRLLHIADPSTQSCLVEKLCWNRACSSGNADDQTTGWTAAPRASHTLCEYQLSWLITLIMLTKALHQFCAKSKQHQMAKKKKKKLVRFYCYFCATCLPIFTWMFMHWAKRHDHNWARTTSSFQVTESLQVDTDWFGFPGGFQFFYFFCWNQRNLPFFWVSMPAFVVLYSAHPWEELLPFFQEGGVKSLCLAAMLHLRVLLSRAFSILQECLITLTSQRA